MVQYFSPLWTVLEMRTHYLIATHLMASHFILVIMLMTSASPVKVSILVTCSNLKESEGNIDMRPRCYIHRIVLSLILLCWYPLLKMKK